MKKILKKLNKGFTLVEIVVTIAIMLIVVSIAVPSAINLSNKSKQRSYELQVKEIETSAKSYVLDNKNKWNVSTIGDSEYCFSLEDLENAEYIEDLEELINPLTSSKFTGSVNIKVVDGKLKYEYSEEECTNSLVSSGLKELQDYDDYLNLNIDNSNGNNIEDNITNTVSKINISKNFGENLTDLEPGIYCEDDYCSFVGATEENYVKFGGNKKMTYPSDIDYNNQAGQDILWRIVSFDKSNNNVKLISDSSVLNSIYNDTPGVINEYETAINFSKFKNVTKFYAAKKANKYKTYSSSSNDGVVPNKLIKYIKNNYSSIGRINSIGNYDCTNDRNISEDKAFESTDQFIKWTKFNEDNSIRIFYRYNYWEDWDDFSDIEIEDNQIKFFAISTDSSDNTCTHYADGGTNPYSCQRSYIDVDKILSIKRIGKNYYSHVSKMLKEIKKKHSNIIIQ